MGRALVDTVGQVISPGNGSHPTHTDLKTLDKSSSSTG